MELFPILGDTPAVKLAKDDKKGDASKEVGAAQNPCPEGYAYADGVCTKAPAQAHVCDPKNEAECTEQCQKGSAASCLNLGRIKKRKDQAAAMPFFKKACDGGAFDGCGALAIQMMPTEYEDPNIATEARAALKVALQGCEGGSGFSCDVAGDMYQDSDFKILDIEAAMKTYNRGCALGYGTSCWSLAKIYFVGKVVPRDAQKGVELLTKACQSGNADECASIAGILAAGKAWGSSEGLTADPERAIGFWRRACLIDATWCDSASKAALKVGQEKEALSLATRGCDAKDEMACYATGLLYEQGKGTAPDAGKAKELFTTACKDGDGDVDACKKLGIPMKE